MPAASMVHPTLALEAPPWLSAHDSRHLIVWGLGVLVVFLLVLLLVLRARAKRRRSPRSSDARLQLPLEDKLEVHLPPSEREAEKVRLAQEARQKARGLAEQRQALADATRETRDAAERRL